MHALLESIMLLQRVQVVLTVQQATTHPMKDLHNAIHVTTVYIVPPLAQALLDHVLLENTVVIRPLCPVRIALLGITNLTRVSPVVIHVRKARTLLLVALFPVLLVALANTAKIWHQHLVLIAQLANTNLIQDIPTAFHVMAESIKTVLDKVNVAYVQPTLIYLT